MAATVGTGSVRLASLIAPGNLFSGLAQPFDPLGIALSPARLMYFLASAVGGISCSIFANIASVFIWFMAHLQVRLYFLANPPQPRNAPVLNPGAKHDRLSPICLIQISGDGRFLLIPSIGLLVGVSNLKNLIFP